MINLKICNNINDKYFFHIIVKTNMNMNMDMTESLKKAALTGGIATALSIALFNESGSVTLDGFNIPTPVITFGSMGIASLVADAGHVYVLPNIPLDKKFENTEALALNAVLGGSALYLSTSMIISDVSFASSHKILALGAASSLSGEYLYNSLLNPKLSNMF